ncbi:MAG: SoxR reducing system RseC family protein [Fusobacteria bacterium]|nr:SoxR reducing system RseC family protein [Fusobacteriota bacterium]
MKYCGKIIKITHAQIMIESNKENCGNCKGCGKMKNRVFSVKNDGNHDFTYGDDVSVDISEITVIFSCFLIYIFPLILFFFSYFIASLITSYELVKISAAFIACGLVFFILHFFELELSLWIERKIHIQKK